MKKDLKSFAYEDVYNLSVMNLDKLQKYLLEIGQENAKKLSLFLIEKIKEKSSFDFQISEQKKSLDYNYENLFSEKKKDLLEMSASELVEYLNDLTAKEKASLVFYLVREIKKTLDF